MDYIDKQLIARGISDRLVLAAFRKVPREAFIPAELRAQAYDDCALPIGQGQTISQPYMVAIMTELLQLKGQEKVMEVGTGSGYQAAILAELCRKVYTIERLPGLSEKAKKILDQIGYKNVEFVVGDGTAGCPEAAPYDGIVVTAGCPKIPEPLVEQLSDSGRLVIPIGDRWQQTLTVVTKKQTQESIACVFVPLIGQYGWPE
jgi:protein-L-isoaspartate(D-aspartate) O-methyltransferase